MGVGAQCHAPATLPLGKTRYPLYRRLYGPQGRSGWVWKIMPPPGFDPWTIQPIVSHYTDYAIMAHIETVVEFLKISGLYCDTVLIYKTIIVMVWNILMSW
jgi:hypothetical protein